MKPTSCDSCGVGEDCILESIRGGYFCDYCGKTWSDKTDEHINDLTNGTIDAIEDIISNAIHKAKDMKCT